LKSREKKIRLLTLKESGIDFFKSVIILLQSFNEDVWIEYGSLLGYVRHNGLIPWDSELDIGMFKKDWSSVIEEALTRMGFEFKHHASRVKIIQPDTYIGAFSIDIHLHEIEGDHTKLLFGETTSTGSISWNYFIWLLNITSKPEVKNRIRFLTIMKSLNKKYDIMDDSLLRKKIVVLRGLYNHEKSFLIEVDNILIEDFFYSELKLNKKIILFLIKQLPTFVRNYIISCISAKVNKPVFKNKFQKISLNFYKNLHYVEFCGIKIKAPVEKEKFLENVYGLDWRKPKINFSRQEMNNLYEY